MRLITQYTEPRIFAEDRLFHNWARQIDVEGDPIGVVLEFTCPRYEDCPSTINGGVPKVSWMLSQGLLSASVAAFRSAADLPAAVVAAILDFVGGEFEDMTERLGGPPIWTEFPHDPPRGRWDFARSDGRHIVIPIP